MQRTAIERYIGEVEPIRLAVNKLLDGADPILHGLATGHIRRADLQQAGRGEIAPSPNGS